MEKKIWHRLALALCATPFTACLALAQPIEGAVTKIPAAALNATGIPAEDFENMKLQGVTLEECLRLALANQPRIHAEMSSAESSEITAQFLNRLKPLAVIPSLGARIEQSKLGVSRARAALNQQIEDTFYAVRRAYYSHIFAVRVQQIVLPLVQAATLSEKALGVKKKIGLKWTSADTDRLALIRFEIAMINKKLHEAQLGVRQTRALLLEEMGGKLRLGFQPVPCSMTLPSVNPRLKLDDLLPMVDEHAGDLLQVQAGRAVTELEVRAQRQFAPLRGMVGTFAAATEESTHLLLRLQLRVIHEDYVAVQQDLAGLEATAIEARQLYAEMTKGLLSEGKAMLLTATATLLADLERAHLSRAVYLAEMVRQTGGFLQVELDHWTESPTDNPAAPPKP
ncbi:MAG: hypothetical protein NTV55_01095 [Planctomycetota bacterium]|nr:hypothetical protein [Planctomycetota bacterium]